MVFADVKRIFIQNHSGFKASPKSTDQHSLKKKKKGEDIERHRNTQRGP